MRTLTPMARVAFLLLTSALSAWGFTLDDLQGLVVGDLSAQTSLNFSSRDPPGNSVRLSGPIPPELGQLTNLTFIRLVDYKLSGTIPPELGNLTRLTSLDVAKNGLSGAIPKEIGNLTSLTNFNPSVNSLTGPIPPELGRLTLLTSLDLSQNSLSGTIPSSLGNLSALTSLQLHDNNLSGGIPPALGNLTLLRSLALQKNQLNGTIPQGLGGLSSLQTLALQNNKLVGSIPLSFAKLKSLSELYLAHNGLTGPIPVEIGQLSGLTNLFLNDNSLSGSIPPSLGGLTRLLRLALQNNNLTGPVPPELGALRSLVLLSLSGNQLSGPIPRELAQLSNVTELYVHNNSLTGAIPPGLGYLPVLGSLFLRDNRLSGPFPTELGTSPLLKVLQVQNNNLSGPVPPAIVARFQAQNVLAGNPGLYVSTDPLSPPPAGPAAGPSSPGGGSKSSTAPWAIIAAVAGGAAVVAIVAGAILLLVCARGRRSQKHVEGDPPPLPGASSSGPRSSGGGVSRESNQPTEREFTLAEILAATGSFAAERVVGSGSFGTVYRGVLGDGTAVAVKRLDVRRAHGAEEAQERAWRNELARLGGVRHRNLVRLLGHCTEAGERLIVLELFPEGSLGARLAAAAAARAPFLPWRARLGVIDGVCRGLAYLHHDIHPPFVHRDIKASNILLRAGGREACIADFGLARLMDDGADASAASSVVKGTLLYMAPEYLHGGPACLSTKCDVYSFGVLVLEVLSGKPVTAGGAPGVPMVEHAARLVREERGRDFVALPDGDESDLAEAEFCLRVALACLQKEPGDRPTMEAVSMQLRSVRLQSEKARPDAGSEAGAWVMREDALHVLHGLASDSDTFGGSTDLSMPGSTYSPGIRFMHPR